MEGVAGFKAIQEKCEDANIEFRSMIQKSVRFVRGRIQALEAEKDETDKAIDTIRENMLKMN